MKSSSNHPPVVSTSMNAPPIMAVVAVAAAAAATCTDTDPGFSCACNAGYTDTSGNGTVCSLASCPANAEGAPNCQCKDGYYGTLSYNGSAWTGSCTAHTTCGPGQYVSVAGTHNSNRECAPCAGDTFSSTNNASSCTP